MKEEDQTGEGIVLDSLFKKTKTTSPHLYWIEGNKSYFIKEFISYRIDMIV